MKWIRSAILSFSLLCTACTYGQDLAETRAMADSAFAVGDIATATQTWLRVYYFSPAGERALAAFRLGECYSALEDHRNAFWYFDYSEKLEPGDSLVLEIQLRRAVEYMRMREFPLAEDALMKFHRLAGEGPEEIRRWAFYMGLLNYLKGDLETSEIYYLACVKDSLARDAVGNIFYEMEKAERLNPKAARIMSHILPGSGQLYAGDARNAANSFLLNAAMLAGGAYVWTAVGLVDAIVIVFPWFFRYYNGGAVNAKRIARRRIADRKAKLFAELLFVVGNQR